MIYLLKLMCALLSQGTNIYTLVDVSSFQVTGPQDIVPFIHTVAYGE